MLCIAVGRVAGARGCELPLDAVQPRVDLRCDVKVGVGGGFTDAVLDAGGAVAAGTADYEGCLPANGTINIAISRALTIPRA